MQYLSLASPLLLITSVEFKPNAIIIFILILLGKMSENTLVLRSVEPVSSDLAVHSNMSCKLHSLFQD